MGWVVDFLTGSETVWRFQSFCGVEKTGENSREKGLLLEEMLTNCTPEARDRDRIVSDHHKTPVVVELPVSEYRIRYKLLHFLFKVGSFLGHEEFYMIFFPFWYWNVDSVTGTKIAILWAVAMYVGQFMKDFLRWPRPRSPPVVHLEHLYLTEFGMPSTHAIVAGTLPLGLAILLTKQCTLPFVPLCVGVISWTCIVCISRVYLGVHSIMDIVGGLAVSYGSMAMVMPYSDTIHDFLMSNGYGLALVFPVAVLCCHFYPSPDRKWTSAYEDTVAIVCSCAGIQTGSHISIAIGILRTRPGCTFGFSLNLLSIVRLVSGVGLILLTRIVIKFICYRVVAVRLGLRSVEEVRQMKMQRVEYWTKFVSYFFMGLCVTFTAPLMFRLYIEKLLKTVA